MTILAALDSEEPLSARTVNLLTGIPLRNVFYHLRILREFELVETAPGFARGNEPPGFLLRLDRHPDWVAQAVESQRDG